MINLLATGTIYICTLSGFVNFPKNLKGPAVLEMKEWITIEVKDSKKKEKIEITIPRERC